MQNFKISLKYIYYKYDFCFKIINYEKIDNFAGSNSTSLRDLNGLYHSNYLDHIRSYFYLVKNDTLISNEIRILKVMDLYHVNEL